MEKIDYLTFKAFSRTIALEKHYRKTMAKLTGKTEEAIKEEIEDIQKEVLEKFKQENNIND